MSLLGGSSSRESSSLGFLDWSPLPDSVIDRGSYGKILVYPSGEEFDRHFYKLSDLSRLSREASVSGSAEVDFYSQGFFCSLTTYDLERIRCRYKLLYGFSLSVPSGEAHSRQSDFVTQYEDALMAGPRLPLHAFVRDLLIYPGIALGQLSPNHWRFLMGAIHL